MNKWICPSRALAALASRCGSDCLLAGMPLVWGFCMATVSLFGGWLGEVVVAPGAPPLGPMPGEGCEALMGAFSLMAGLAAGALASFFRLMTLKWSVLNLIITAPLLMVEPSLGDWISRRGASAAKAAITAHRTNAIGRTNLAYNLDISLLLLREIGWGAGKKWLAVKGGSVTQMEVYCDRGYDFGR